MRVLIYSRPGCHLCDDMKRVVAEVAARLPDGSVEVSEVDISTEAALEHAYGREIPVLLIDGRKAAKYRITAEALERKLRA